MEASEDGNACVAFTSNMVFKAVWLLTIVLTFCQVVQLKGGGVILVGEASDGSSSKHTMEASHARTGDI